MRQMKRKTTLGRLAAPRKALLRGLLTALALHGKIRTTEAKGKAIKPHADHIISVAKRGTLASTRQLYAILQTRSAVTKLLSTVKSRYANRQSGYIRIIKIGPRKGDGAPMVQVELVD